MGVYACNPTTQEVETEGDQGHLSLHRIFEASLKLLEIFSQKKVYCCVLTRRVSKILFEYFVYSYVIGSYWGHWSKGTCCQEGATHASGGKLH